MPAVVDLAVVAIPAPTVPKIIGECADAGVRGAIVLSAGFKECGEAGAALERQVLAQARRGQMRQICRKLGFRLHSLEGIVRAEIEL